jgi:hypothetical protein
MALKELVSQTWSHMQWCSRYSFLYLIISGIRTVNILYNYIPLACLLAIQWQ